jgi:trans-aconitate methyltransferase
VCDLGCGFGDLYPYLVKRFGRVSYYGIDLSVPLIEEARRRLPSVDFEMTDILETVPDRKWDYVLSSGVLSFKVDNHEQHVRDMLSAMFAMSKRGVAVNFLSTYVDYQMEKNFHFKPEAALTMAYGMTKKVVLRSDYPLYEFTLYIYH